jgi:hypothetical protein
MSQVTDQILYPLADFARSGIGDDLPVAAMAADCGIASILQMSIFSAISIASSTSMAS